MRGFISVVIREMIERRSVAGAALAAAILPLALPLVPGVANWPAGDIRGSMAWGMSLGLTWILAMILGAGLVGSDLTAGRMGFYLTRPISVLSIWFGKVFACYVIVVCCEFVVLLPAVVIPGSELYFMFIHEGPWWKAVGLLFGVPLLFIVAAHALGIMFRARSAWLFLDVVAFFVVVGVCFSKAAKFAGTASGVFFAIPWILAGMFLLALLIAGAIQFVIGRADLKRGHRALSLSLWAMMGVTTLSLVGYTAWFFSITVEDLTSIRFVQGAPEGDWIYLSGQDKARFDHQASFLYNVSSGASLKIKPSVRWYRQTTTFSADGTVAAWMAWIEPGMRQIESVDLTQEQPQVRVSNLLFKEVVDIALSPSGRNIFVFEEGNVTIYQLASGRILTTAVLEENTRIRKVTFTSEESARLIVLGEWNKEREYRRLEVYDLSTDGLTLAGMLGDVGMSVHLEVDPVASRMFRAYWAGQFWSMILAEVPSGRILQRFSDSDYRGDAVFRDDGRFLRTELQDGRVSLMCEGRDPEEPVFIPLGTASKVRIGGRLADGRIVVGLWTPEDDVRFRSLLVDPESGAVITIGDALRPATHRFGMFFGSRLPGPETSSLFIDDARGTLLKWNPETAELVKILGAD